MKKAVFSKARPYSSCIYRRFGGTYILPHLRTLLRVLVAANIPISLILVNLMIEAMFLRNVGPYKSHTDIPEEGIRHGHRHENLKSYIALTG
jgi:hypothetical protein